MNQPGRLYNLFKTITIRSAADPQIDAVSGHPAVDDVVREMPPVEIATLLKHVRTWNANAKSSVVAQTILHTIFKLRKTEDISEALSSTAASDTSTKKGADSLSELVHALIPYTERHLTRLDRLVQDSYILDFVLGEMDGGMLANGDEIMI